MNYRSFPWFIGIPCVFACPILSAEELAKGLIYTQYTTATHQVVHVLKIDPAAFTLKTVHAKGQALGLKTLTKLARREAAVAAINGGFFQIGEGKNGLPAGILKVRQRWYGIAYSNRGAIGWSDPMHTILIDRIQTKTTLQIDSTRFPVHAVNRPGLASKAILYTDAYGAATDAVAGSKEVVIQNNRIIDIVSSGKAPIPRGGYVYSLGPKAKGFYYPFYQKANVHFQIEVIPSFKKEQFSTWQTLDNIVGGTPLLLENGRIVQDYRSERLHAPFIHLPCARTAIGILGSGHLVCVVVEKNNLTGSRGMTIPQLSFFLKKLGCIDALNLDGGASSTLYIKDKIVNHSDSESDLERSMSFSLMRRIGDAIVVLPKAR